MVSLNFKSGDDRDTWLPSLQSSQKVAEILDHCVRIIELSEAGLELEVGRLSP